MTKIRSPEFYCIQSVYCIISLISIKWWSCVIVTDISYTPNISKFNQNLYSWMMLIFVQESSDTCTHKRMSLSKNMKDLNVTKLIAHNLTWTHIYSEFSYSKF